MENKLCNLYHTKFDEPQQVKSAGKTEEISRHYPIGTLKSRAGGQPEVRQWAPFPTGRARLLARLFNRLFLHYMVVCDGSLKRVWNCLVYF